MFFLSDEDELHGQLHNSFAVHVPEHDDHPISCDTNYRYIYRKKSEMDVFSFDLGEIRCDQFNHPTRFVVDLDVELVNGDQISIDFLEWNSSWIGQ